MKHGTRGGYTRHGCTCDACVKAERDYQQFYRSTINRVKGRGLVSAAPVVARIETLVSRGMSYRSVGIAAGLGEMTVISIVRDGQNVRVSTRDKVMAVPIPGVTPVGIKRRMQALAAIGWSTRQIADRAGVNVDTVKAIARGDTMPRPWIRDALLPVYDELHMTPRTAHAHDDRLSLSRTLAWARDRGFAPPMAWDDIDDEDATPSLSRPGRRIVRTGLDLDDWLFLVRSGEDPARAARRCGVTISAVEVKARRHGRRDVLDAALGARAQTRKEAA